MATDVTDNVALARRYIEEVWSRGDVAIVVDALTPDYLDRSQGHTREQVTGRPRQHFRYTFRAYFWPNNALPGLAREWCVRISCVFGCVE